MRHAVDHGVPADRCAKTNGSLPVDSLGGTGSLPRSGGDLLRGDDAIPEGAQYRDPSAGSGAADDQNSFDLLIPVLVVVLTLYPLSLFIQHHFDMLIPQAIMAIFKPLVSAADSLPAILLAVLIGHLLWFAGIHGAAIVSGMLQMFWLTNLGMNQQALAQGAPLPHILWKRSGRSSSLSAVPAQPWGWCSAICAAVPRICALSAV